MQLLVNTGFFIDTLGWVAAVLIVGAYFLNIHGKWTARSPAYISCNLIGGILFTLNTGMHGAYPSMVVNIIWVLIALAALRKKMP